MMPLKSMLSVALFALLLTACDIVITGGTVWPDDVIIRNAGYLTDAKATIDGHERFVICDDRVADLTYFFEYEGDLAGWTSYLKGVTTGDVIGVRTFTPSSPGVTYTSQDVLVTYAIDPGIAPLAQDDLTTEAIVVVPVPEVLGYTRLYLRLESTGSVLRLVSSDIPVLANCVG